MIDKRNEIFTRVESAVEKLCGHCTQTYSATQNTFPTLYFKQSDNPVTSTDLDGNECASTPLIQVDVYTSGANALMKANKIIELSDDEMRAMHFKRIFGPQPMENLANSNITRLVTRYKRVLASGDEL